MKTKLIVLGLLMAAASFATGRYIGRYDGPTIEEVRVAPPVDYASMGMPDDGMALFGGVMTIRARHKQQVLVSHLAVIEQDGLVTITGIGTEPGVPECQVVDTKVPSEMKPDLTTFRYLNIEGRL